MDAGDGERAAAVERGEGDGHEVAGRREHDGRVERLRAAGRRCRPPRPRPAPSASRRALAEPGQHVHRRALGERDLGGEVGRAAEPVDAEPPSGRAARPRRSAR